MWARCCVNALNLLFVLVIAVLGLYWANGSLLAFAGVYALVMIAWTLDEKLK